ncbi:MULTISPECIES: hypothetical protein [Micromonospora]|uniref:ABC-2 type transport system permease protein n=1 Tax=Micromonospora solifontis TaxID=2487138 RepID=A0ABX9WLA6_9ACTN|nr:MULTISPECIES: hypothetical protein [Micromonospora]NES12583.1 hypothetical protein [Micromonospora sp. PPF5-17B]NES36466.1 hypothetical protein [Micromonospora solifontis]NES54532.1 hypothetical protein [Micromonospora sp. PPF5-6]RNL99522.1 hypothetical protein EFE23_09850 [Micromonospora solifontis]
MIALVRLRLAGFVRTGVALAPVLAGLLALGVLYGGGRAQPAEAYAVSAVVLFPVLAWQTKILLDVEPDVQRRLAQVVLGPARERAAGLLAAAVAGFGTVVVALIFPWLVGGVTGPTGPGDRAVVVGVALGVWVHLLALPGAVGLGALASRAITRSAGYGVAVLAVGVVGALVLGLSGSAVPWLAPPLMPAARALTGHPGPTTGVLLTAWAAAWATAALAGYAWGRRTRP